MKKKSILFLLLAVLCFLTALSRLEDGHRALGRQQLEQAVRRTAVSCYALEGQYPPSVDYMKTHYGLTYDENRYSIHYDVFAANLMPDITVLDQTP